MSRNAESGTDAIAFDPTDRKLGVVVGFDGSTNSQLALRYGARAAQRRSSALTVVTSFTISPQVYTTLAAVPRVPEAELKQKATQETLDQARELLKDYPGEVTYQSEEGDAAGVLVDKSEDAQLVVLGARGRGGFLGLMLGSVASSLPAHAQSPTVIVPKNYQGPEVDEGPDQFAPSEDSRPVVVGLDGSQQSRVAVLHAAQAAAERKVTLQLVMVLPPVEGALLWYPEFSGRAAEATKTRQDELQETLDAERAWVEGHFPDLDVQASVEPGDPITVLREKSRSAQLTVAGTRGRGEFGSLVLGSVSRGLLVKAAGPVMVVPQLGDDRL
ncbi:universal stress protein [Garicola koreensis]|uniref:universal stress protein n=1 Tax=Garicola koreensis TaxID=1262554 RepID=UPI0031E89DA4